MTSDNRHRQDGPTEQARAEQVADDLSHWVARVVGRAREEAEDLWAEAQALRQQERSVMRRGVAYGLAGAIRAGDRIRAAARGAAEGARNGSQRTDQAESGPAEAKQP
jgi:hypothetical protein